MSLEVLLDISHAVRGGGTRSRSQVRVGEGRVWRPVDDGVASPRGYLGWGERARRGVRDEGQLSVHQGEGRVGLEESTMPYSEACASSSSFTIARKTPYRFQVFPPLKRWCSSEGVNLRA